MEARMKTDKIDLSKLAKILGKLGSDSDHEVQVAIKQALAMLKAGKCNWQDVLKEAKPKPRKRPPTQHWVAASSRPRTCSRCSPRTGARSWPASRRM